MVGDGHVEIYILLLKDPICCKKLCLSACDTVLCTATLHNSFLGHYTMWACHMGQKMQKSNIVTSQNTTNGHFRGGVGRGSVQ